MATGDDDVPLGGRQGPPLGNAPKGGQIVGLAGTGVKANHPSAKVRLLTPHRAGHARIPLAEKQQPSF
jgi:hypothetical protein